MYTSMDILILSVDIKRGGSPDGNLNFYDQMARVVKGQGEHEFVLFIICRIATWNKLSISPTFYEQLLHQNPFAKKLQTQIGGT